jgi:quinol-cytochrome oxidoreductase complex cytochrome b subunit
MHLQRRLYQLMLIALVAVAAGFLLGGHGTFTPSTPADDDRASAASLQDIDVQEAITAKDTCTTCHLDREQTGAWFPLLRWLAFGAAGVALGYGIWRSAYLWTRRRHWRGGRERLADYLERQYGFTWTGANPVPLWSPRWWLKCLGGLAVLALMVQAITGVMLAFHYQPNAAVNPATGFSYAYESVQRITNEVRFGGLVRTVHHWSANTLIVLTALHMARVFIRRAYTTPRGASWRWGVLLLALVLSAGFTGYLLPWDQKAFWAATVGSDIAGHMPVIGKPALLFIRDGWMVTGATLQRFYGLHVFVIPACVVAVLALHLHRRKFWTKVALRQWRQWWIALTALIVTAAVLAEVAPLELGAPADPLDPPEAPKPAWFFLFIYQFLKLVPGVVTVSGRQVLRLGPTFAVSVLVILVALLALVPALDRARGDSGRARRWRWLVVMVSVAVFVALTLWGAASGA